LYNVHSLDDQIANTLTKLNSWWRMSDVQGRLLA